MVGDTQGDARRISRATEVVAVVVGFFLGFVLSQPFLCVSSANGAEHTECQNLLMMSFSPPYYPFVGFAGGIAGAIILGTGTALAQRIRGRSSSTS